MKERKIRELGERYCAFFEECNISPESIPYNLPIARYDTALQYGHFLCKNIPKYITEKDILVPSLRSKMDEYAERIAAHHVTTAVRHVQNRKLQSFRAGLEHTLYMLDQTYVLTSPDHRIDRTGKAHRWSGMIEGIAITDRLMTLGEVMHGPEMIKVSGVGYTVRLIGRVQGILWVARKFTLDQIREHNNSPKKKKRKDRSG